MPLSAVCRNQPGSLFDNDAAISSLLGSTAPACAFVAPAFVLSAPMADVGRLPPLDCGLLCCHDSVPLLARVVALGDAWPLCSEACGWTTFADDAELLTLLNPVNSGTFLVGEGGPLGALWASIAAADVDGVNDGGEVKALEGACGFGLSRSLSCAGLSGEIERARSSECFD